MKFWEIREPYYALIKAKYVDEAIECYIDIVSGDEHDFDDLAVEIKEVDEVYAIASTAQVTTEDKELMDLKKIVEIIKSDKTELLAMDGSLI